MKKKYNENLGKTNTSTISPKDGVKAFSELINELDELKRIVSAAEMDIIRGMGDKEKLQLNLSIWKKRIKIIENAIKLESLLKAEGNNSHSPPKVEDKNKTEYVPKSSPIQTRYKPINNKAPKPKKPWWKFW